MCGSVEKAAVHCNFSSCCKVSTSVKPRSRCCRRGWPCSSQRRRRSSSRALTDLGAALRRAGRRREAREPLTRALEIAHRHAAAPLAAAARTELLAAGARPRRAVRTGVDALTASERRVAELAAAGLSNAEIAARLFITRKTTEHHLAAIYRKLGIGSRRELPAALGGALSPPPMPRSM
jgi:DNA-binding CsgD family transcriptional regulator